MGQVLVVESERELRNVLFRFLSGAGYEVLTAINLVEAVELMQRCQPSLVIVGDAPPGVDGYAAAQALRAVAVDTAIPLLLIANPARINDEQAHAAGYAGFVSKPFDVWFFVGQVANTLRSISRARGQ